MVLRQSEFDCAPASTLQNYGSLEITALLFPAELHREIAPMCYVICGLGEVRGRAEQIGYSQRWYTVVFRDVNWFLIGFFPLKKKKKLPWSLQDEHWETRARLTTSWHAMHIFSPFARKMVLLIYTDWTKLNTVLPAEDWCPTEGKLDTYLTQFNDEHSACSCGVQILTDTRFYLFLLQSMGKSNHELDKIILT